MRRVLIVSSLVALLAAAPASAKARRSLSLPFHTRVTLTGQTLGSRPGHHALGRVYATARWNRGARYVVGVPATDSAGNWRVTFLPSHRGFYDLRVLTPDGARLEYAFRVH
jgi:hypothetical protein